MNYIQWFVHQRLRTQRGQAFIAMITQVLIVVGVWRQYLPSVHWWILVLFGGAAYLLGAWLLGLLDEKALMFKYEQERMTQMNPQVLRILKIVEMIHEDKMEEKIDALQPQVNQILVCTQRMEVDLKKLTEEYDLAW